MTINNEKLLSFNKAAALSGIPLSTLYYWARQGKLMTFSKEKKKFIKKDDLEKVIRETKSYEICSIQEAISILKISPNELKELFRKKILKKQKKCFRKRHEQKFYIPLREILKVHRQKDINEQFYTIVELADIWQKPVNDIEVLIEQNVIRSSRLERKGLSKKFPVIHKSEIMKLIEKYKIQNTNAENLKKLSNLKLPIYLNSLQIQEKTGISRQYIEELALNEQLPYDKTHTKNSLFPDFVFYEFSILYIKNASIDQINQRALTNCKIEILFNLIKRISSNDDKELEKDTEIYLQKAIEAVIYCLYDKDIKIKQSAYESVAQIPHFYLPKKQIKSWLIGITKSGFDKMEKCLKDRAMIIGNGLTRKQVNHFLGYCQKIQNEILDDLTQWKIKISNMARRSNEHITHLQNNVCNNAAHLQIKIQIKDLTESIQENEDIICSRIATNHLDLFKIVTLLLQSEYENINRLGYRILKKFANYPNSQPQLASALLEYLDKIIFYSTKLSKKIIDIQTRQNRDKILEKLEVLTQIPLPTKKKVFVKKIRNQIKKTK